MKQSNDESIHQHNAHAERVVEMGRLREVNGELIPTSLGPCRPITGRRSTDNRSSQTPSQ